MKNLLLSSILVFSIDPASNQVVLTSGPEYIEVVNVEKVIYKGKVSDLPFLMNEQIKGKVLTIDKFDGKVLNINN